MVTLTRKLVTVAGMVMLMTVAAQATAGQDQSSAQLEDRRHSDPNRWRHVVDRRVCERVRRNGHAPRTSFRQARGLRVLRDGSDARVELERHGDRRPVSARGRGRTVVHRGSRQRATQRGAFYVTARRVARQASVVRKGRLGRRVRQDRRSADRQGRKARLVRRAQGDPGAAGAAGPRGRRVRGPQVGGPQGPVGPQTAGAGGSARCDRRDGTAGRPRAEWPRGRVDALHRAVYDDPGDILFGVALCPGTKRPVAGGYEGTGNGPQLNLVQSAPSTQGWRITLRNNTAGSVSNVGMRVYVVCAFVQ
jgi:hypothetical protein